MKIISLNAWGGKQQAELKQYIQEHKASTDIFLFQEADEQIELLRKTELEGWLAVAADQCLVGSPESFFNASVFKEGALLVSSGVLATSKQRAFGLWTELLYQGETYFICSIHGIAFPGDKLDTEERLDQTKMILEFLKGKPGKHIIMGDFNLFPDTESILQIERAGYRNLIKEYNIETTRNAVSWAMHNNKQLWADYTFVGPGIEVIDFQVPQNLVSYHLPMELTIQ